jgi:hypothetical protein
MKFEDIEGSVQATNNEVKFSVFVDRGKTGYRVTVERNEEKVYESTRLSSTLEKAEQRARKALAAVLRDEIRTVKSG